MRDRQIKNNSFFSKMTPSDFNLRKVGRRIFNGGGGN